MKRVYLFIALIGYHLQLVILVYSPRHRLRCPLPFSRLHENVLRCIYFLKWLVIDLFFFFYSTKTWRQVQVCISPSTFVFPLVLNREISKRELFFQFFKETSKPLDSRLLLVSNFIFVWLLLASLVYKVPIKKAHSRVSFSLIYPPLQHLTVSYFPPSLFRLIVHLPKELCPVQPSHVCAF